MKKTLAAIVAASFLTMGIGYCDEPTEYDECIKKYEHLVPGEDYVKGEFLLGFDKGVTPKEAEEFIESHDSNNEIEMVKRKLKWFEYTLVKVPEGKEVEYACYFDSLKDETIVRYAEPNQIIRIIFPKVKTE